MPSAYGDLFCPFLVYMKILQVTNIVSHHQLPLARELCKLVGADNFRFAAMESVNLSRVENGWDSSFSEPWILRTSENESDMSKFEEFWDAADIVLCGERLIEKMQARVRDKKICFYMSERWWKPPMGALRLLQPRYFSMALRFRQLSKNKYFHYLPIGPAAASDIVSFTSMKNRIWNWGYFTEKPSLHKIKQNEDTKPLRVLWAGRMLNCKRVDLLIKAVAVINSSSKRLCLTLIGDGPERSKLEKLAANLLDEKDYAFSGFIPSNEVPRIMVEHDIYVLPSNSYEGWGAVINEAMSVGCVVVASDQTGSGRSMIKHGVNGLLFRSGSVTDLTSCLQRLYDDADARNNISAQAIRDFTDLWSPSIAAHRFLQVSDALLHGDEFVHFAEGPMKLYKA